MKMIAKAADYMAGMAQHQTGDVGDITAGLPPYDYTKGLPYLEWYGDDNGRVVVEPDSDQIKSHRPPHPRMRERSDLARAAGAEHGQLPEPI